MYRPREFAMDDAAVLRQHVVDNPMGIIASARGRLDATHLPFLLDDETGDAGDLISHYAIRNAQLSALVDGDEVLVVFPGPHAYVSASMYRAEPDVPTWNYTAVHVRGRFVRTSADSAPAPAKPPRISKTPAKTATIAGGETNQTTPQETNCMARHFQFVEGNSCKFWEVSVADKDVTVRFGRVGSQGQTQTKSLPDSAAASKHAEKLIAEKLKKGYIESTS